MPLRERNLCIACNCNFAERPLLVHKTKIDIRQWFLITNMQPLVVWMYKYGTCSSVNVAFMPLEDFR